MATRQAQQVPRAPIGRSSLPVIAAIFVVTFAIAQILLALLFANGYLDWLIELTTVVAAGLITSLGIPATVSGNQITMTNHILEIVPDCTGLTLAALYASLVIAYPLSWTTRLYALAVGVPVIAVANMLRLLAVALASEHLSAEVFDFAHDYLFMGIMVLVVIALWAAWLQVARTRATRT
jgi:exosortase/archaeosortase family protein